MSMTLRRNATSDEPAANGQLPEAETQMRRALGLLPSAVPRARPRSGDGPLVEHRGDRQSGASVNRLAAAEAALIEERQSREQLARQLRDAEAALHEARTKRGHAELARDEAMAALAAERSAREAVEERIRQLCLAPSTPAATSETPAGSGRAARRRAAVATDLAAPVKRRGRPPGSGSKIVRIAAVGTEGSTNDDGEMGDAVEWWVPGWRERV